MHAPAPSKLAAPAIRLHPNDSVLIARVDLAQGSVLGEDNLTCLNRIPAGHKIAARALRQGDPVLKYNTIFYSVCLAAAGARPPCSSHGARAPHPPMALSG